MMSISKWQSSTQAENYFQEDLDYYQKNQELGEWHITGEMANRYSHIAHRSSITKESYQDFSDLLRNNSDSWMYKQEGYDQLTQEEKATAESMHQYWLDNKEDGEIRSFELKEYVKYVQEKHKDKEPPKNGNENSRAGFDITFSPSKSVDAIYAVADKQMQNAILKAQDRAVNVALERASEYITYRMRTKEGRLHFKNNGLAVAKFQHLTNRNQETKIHTHCFVANQTVNEKGKIVSLDNIRLYENQKLITQIYHQELFQQMQKLGFKSEVLDIKKDILEIKGVSKEARESISTRTAEIDKYLEENRKELLTKYPNANESKLRQIATLETSSTIH